MMRDLPPKWTAGRARQSREFEQTGTPAAGEHVGHAERAKGAPEVMAGNADDLAVRPVDCSTYRLICVQPHQSRA